MKEMQDPQIRVHEGRVMQDIKARVRDFPLFVTGRVAVQDVQELVSDLRATGRVGFTCYSPAGADARLLIHARTHDHFDWCLLAKSPFGRWGFVDSREASTPLTWRTTYELVAMDANESPFYLRSFLTRHDIQKFETWRLTQAAYEAFIHTIRHAHNSPNPERLLLAIAHEIGRLIAFAGTVQQLKALKREIETSLRNCGSPASLGTRSLGVKPDVRATTERLTKLLRRFERTDSLLPIR